MFILGKVLSSIEQVLVHIYKQMETLASFLVIKSYYM